MIDEDNDEGDDVLLALNRMRMRGLGCDAVLGTEDGGMFRVHKIAMSWCSSYFRTVFTTSLVDMGAGEGQKGRSFIVIPNVSSSALETIIKYAYSGVTDVRKDNVNEILPAADQFSVLGMVENCTSFLLSNLTPENCLGVWRFGREYFMPQLANDARSYALGHFPEVATQSEEFLDLALPNLKCLLKDDVLNTPDELFVWAAIKRWYQHNARERLHSIPSILGSVRMAAMPITDFQQIMDDPRVFQNIHCRPFITVMVKYILNELSDIAQLEAFRGVASLFTPRLPHDVIFCIGGWSVTGPTNNMEVYDCRIDVWKMISTKNSLKPRAFHKSVALGKYIYIIGGNEGSASLNSCFRFDTDTLTFEEVSPMQDQRCYPSAVVLSDKIYAIGGYDGFERLQTVECFLEKQNQWLYVSPMHLQRSDASACVLRNRIFVAGGFDGKEHLRSAECYYEEFDQWYLLPNMKSCRSGMGCVAVKNAIYALGGFNGTERIRTVEKYDIDNRQWSPGKPMKTTRSNFGAEVLENKIYVMGGADYESEMVTDHSECFDLSKQRWMSIASLNVARSGLSTCLFSGLKNVRDYTKEDKYRCFLTRTTEETPAAEENPSNVTATLC